MLTLFIVGLLARFARAEPAAIEASAPGTRGRLARLLLPVPAAAVDPVRPRRRPEERRTARRCRPSAAGRTVVRGHGGRARRPRRSSAAGRRVGRAAATGRRGPAAAAVRPRRGGPGGAPVTPSAVPSSSPAAAPAGTSSRCSRSPTRCAAGPDAGLRITCLGTARGMETRLVPARGYDLRLIPPVPLPRKPTLDLLRVPGRVVGARRARPARCWPRLGADVVVGFGGYVALPAYLAARRATVPVVVHEQNALPGLANRIGARLAARVAVTVPGHAAAPRRARRHAAADRDQPAWTGPRAGPRPAPSSGWTPTGPTLLVFGGSQGAASLNRAAVAAADALDRRRRPGAARPGAEEHRRRRCRPARPGQPPYVVVDYLERMDLAYAAADLALCRAGAVTVAELSAVGLPAAFVPLPIGNGEQRRNALPVVEAGGGAAGRGRRADARSGSSRTLVPLLTDPRRWPR